jgi:TonB family protein
VVLSRARRGVTVPNKLFRLHSIKNAPARILARAGLALTLSLGLASIALAQDEGADRVGRKVIENPQPVYPPIVKKAHIGGTVRLKATVMANGTVAKVAIVGGNPILAASAVEAVMKRKYAPAASQTEQLVSITFDPTH